MRHVADRASRGSVRKRCDRGEMGRVGPGWVPVGHGENERASSRPRVSTLITGHTVRWLWANLRIVSSAAAASAFNASPMAVGRAIVGQGSGRGRRRSARRAGTGRRRCGGRGVARTALSRWARRTGRRSTRGLTMTTTRPPRRAPTPSSPQHPAASSSWCRRRRTPRPPSHTSSP
jgi:hypothetical protein